MKKLSFRPFRAYRPRNDVAPNLTCEPYNKTNHQEARSYASTHEANFIHVIKPEVDLDVPVKQYDVKAGEKGKQSLQDLINKKMLVQDNAPSFYIYAQKKNNISHVCVIGDIAVKHYHEGLIKGHELTIKEKEDALEAFTRVQNAHLDPVLLTYRANGKLKSFMLDTTKTKPAQQFSSEDGIEHCVWQISSPEDIALIEEATSHIPNLYIADGHHRSAVAQRMHKSINPQQDHPYNHLLAAICPDSLVHLADYNRVIRDLNGLIPEIFLHKLASHFSIKQVDTFDKAKPTEPHSFGMLLNDIWYTLKTKNSVIEQRTENPLDLVDMSILNNLVVEPILGIDSLYDNSRIECVGGISCLTDLEKKCCTRNNELAFALHPVPMEHFMQVVDSGQLMPAKTTWFEPKMRPGLIVRMFQ